MRSRSLVFAVLSLIALGGLTLASGAGGAMAGTGAEQATATSAPAHPGPGNRVTTQWAYNLDPGQIWTVPFNPRAPLTTPNTLDVANPAVLRALADAVLSMRASHTALNATFGQVQHATRGRDIIPVHGCSGAIGCFNVIEANASPGNPFTPGDYGEADRGSSLVMTTELTPGGPVSQGILTYSQATDPLSPWYANMTKLYSEKRWVHLPYTPAQLAAQPRNHTMVLAAP